MNRLPPLPSAGAAERAAGALPAAGLAVLLLAACAVFLALGTWQVQRRHWKLALIEQVQARIHAAPQPAPARGRWPEVSAAADAYRHVHVSGRFVGPGATLVQAVTALGAGHWVLTPLQADDGSKVLVNRGFVAASTMPAAAPAGPVTVTGLLRISEPGGAFLRRNDPGAGRWHSRDVQAIGAALRLRDLAPYFIDADAAVGPQALDAPVGGLTVVAFHNNHLVYALTWYALAAMSAWGVWRVRRERRAVAAEPGRSGSHDDATVSH